MFSFRIEAEASISGESIVMAMLAVVATTSAWLLYSKAHPVVPLPTTSAPTAPLPYHPERDRLTKAGTAAQTSSVPHKSSAKFIETVTQTEVRKIPTVARQLTAIRRDSLPIRPELPDTHPPATIVGVSHHRPAPIQRVSTSDAAAQETSGRRVASRPLPRSPASPIQIHAPRPLRPFPNLGLLHQPSVQRVQAANSIEHRHHTPPVQSQTHNSQIQHPYVHSSRLNELRRLHLTPIKTDLPARSAFWVSATLLSHRTAAEPIAYALAGYEVDDGYSPDTNHASDCSPPPKGWSLEPQDVAHKTRGNRRRRWRKARQHSLEMRVWTEPGCAVCEDGSVYSLQDTATSGEENTSAKKGLGGEGRQRKSSSMIGGGVLPSPVSSFDEHDPTKQVRELAVILRGLQPDF